MRTIVSAIAALSMTAQIPAADQPLVEPYLHAGQLARGEQALEAALAAAPKDDQIRFGLAVLQLVRGVERLGQALHEYGAKSASTDVPFLRLPVPNNPDPAPMHYLALRRLLDDFRRDLATTEATLAGVTDEKVKLPLRLGPIRLDLDGDGKPTDRFIDILKRVMQRQTFVFLESNPEMLVCFDRGDVAWLRAYCHLLMGMLDFYLAFDTEREFALAADQLFARPRQPFRGDDAERRKHLQEAGKEVRVAEPARLGRFRRHFIRVAELNRETWKYIRAETDDDHEWLPSPRQKGVLGLAVRDGMIDAWLALMAEMEALLDGRRTFLRVFIQKQGKGLNLKALLDDPPEKFVLDGAFPQNLPDRYWFEGKDVDVNVLWFVIQAFGDSTAAAYAVWFN
jgi:hypothetical protein